MKSSAAFFAAAVSGVLLFFAYPPVGLGFIAWFALVPMLHVVLNHGPGRVFLLSYVSGLFFLGLSLTWIAMHPDLHWIVMVLAVAVLAVFYTLPFVLASMVGGLSAEAALLVFPFAAAGLEWVRSFDPFAFPWMIYGNSQTCYPSLIQYADITSVYGVSFWVAAVNIVLYRIIKRPRSLVDWTLIAALFAAPYLYSRSVIARGEEPGETLTVALIQGNVPPDEKWEEGMEEWNINLYRSMSIQAMAYRPSLIVWPETAVPAYLADIAPYRRMVQSFVDSTGVPVLTGMPSIDWSTGETWNSAGLFSPGETDVARYDKLHLVPFGEAFPFDNIFPSLRNIDMGQANWDEGSDIVVFDTPGLPPFNAVICFESIFPDLVRRFIVRGSQLIVVITNDVWFGPYASPIQHAMISVMRAVEFHRPVVRCANTGISMVIDRYGRIQGSTQYGERTYLIGTARPSARMTFYAKHGNVFGIGCFVVSLATVIGYFIARKRSVSGNNAVQ